MPPNKSLAYPGLFSKARLESLISLIDLTSLNENDTQSVIEALCQQAHTPYGNTAAICIYPQFIRCAKQILATQQTEKIRVATVINFPTGVAPLAQILNQAQQAVEAGADEIDMVLPYQQLIQGETAKSAAQIAAVVKLVQGFSTVKVIIESGLLQHAHLIELACEIAIENGTHFIKTSTGKVAVNATLEAAAIMLKTIARKNPECGFKAAGGIRNAIEAQHYLILAEKILGPDWISDAHFRFGASSLLQDVLCRLENKPAAYHDGVPSY